MKKLKTTPGPALKTRDLRSFIAMDILEASQKLQRQGKDIISFSIGEPDFPAPAVVKREIIRAIQEDFTQYTHSLGMPELREAISEHYANRYQVSVHPDQILVTAGTSPALLLTFGALLNRGDEVVISDPHYPCYSNFIKFLEGRLVYVPVREKDGFQFRPEEVKKKLTSRTKAIFLNSPSNPTGCVMQPAVLKKISNLGKMIVSDEIYHGLTYEGEERSILEFTDQAFVLNGFSKAYAMTGFRLGYLIAPKKFIPVLQKMQQNFFISTSSFTQRAGIAALKRTMGAREKMRRIFNQRRKVMLDGVRQLGFGVATDPTGAFYVFANAKHYTRDSYRFAMDLLNSTGVGVTPGIDFGPGGEGYLRFSYATDVKRIKEGLARIQDFLHSRKLLD